MKKLSTIFLTVYISFFSLGVKAGIPTVDAGSIAQAIIMIDEAKREYERTKARFEQELELLKGDDFGGYVFDSSFVYMDGMENISDSEVDGYLTDVDIGESESELKRKYEEQAKQIARLEKAMGNVRSEAQKIDNLAVKLGNAKTPRERESVLNSIQLAKLSAETAQRALNNEMSKQDQINKIKEKEAINKHIDNSMEKPSIGGYFQLD